MQLSLTAGDSGSGVPLIAEGGVLGVLPGTVGLLQATETIKLLLGIGTTLGGRLLHFDALAMRFRETRLAPDHLIQGTTTSIAISGNGLIWFMRMFPMFTLTTVNRPAPRRSQPRSRRSGTGGRTPC